MDFYKIVTRETYRGVIASKTVSYKSIFMSVLGLRVELISSALRGKSNRPAKLFTSPEQ